MIKIKRVLPPGYIIKDVDHSELEDVESGLRFERGEGAGETTRCPDCLGVRST
jgi:hypothetical protein